MPVGRGDLVGFSSIAVTAVCRRYRRTRRIQWRSGLANCERGAYRKQLNIPHRVMIPLIVTSVIGGVAGAFLLIKTPAHTFLRVLPWLLLGATLLFAFGKHLTGRISAGISHESNNAAITVRYF